MSTVRLFDPPGAPATFDLIVNGATVNLNAANSYLGKTVITSVVAGDGILNAGPGGALPVTNGRSAVVMDNAGAGGSLLNISGTTLFPGGANQAIASLEGLASSKVTLGGNTLTIGFGTAPNTNGTASAVFAGVISGNGALRTSKARRRPGSQIVIGSTKGPVEKTQYRTAPTPLPSIRAYFG